MKFVILSAVLTLVLRTDASKHLLCKPEAGSIIHFLVKDKGQAMTCSTNSSYFEMTEPQYQSIVSRLQTTENGLSEMNSALASVKEDLSQKSDKIYTQLLVQETVDNAMAKVMPLLLKRSVLKALQLDGWKESGDFAFKVFTDKVSYSTATANCKSYGGRLAAEILRHPDAVRSIIAGGYIVDYSKGTAPWVGYTDTQREGQWTWVDGGSTNAATTGWNTGEPNSSGGNEDCGHIFKHVGGKVLLNDSTCSSKYSYICEIDLLAVD